MLEGYPFTGHFLKRNDFNYHYLDEGEGETVVMVHGNPTWSYYYRDLVLALKDHYRVVVPDHMGCGFSDTPPDSAYAYTLKNRVDDLEALLDHLELRENITLVLHDWGGMIGMAWASRHPERVARLVLLNTAAFPLPTEKPFPLALKFCRMPVIGPLLVQGLNLFASKTSRFGCQRHPMSASTRKGYLHPYSSWKKRRAILRFVQDIPLDSSHPSYPILAEVSEGLHRFTSTPTMLLWGEKDFVFDHSFLEEWQRRLPSAEVHSFWDCGHYILEDAKEEILPLVQQFLENHPLPTLNEAP